jgi:Ca2+-binding RTX toxin-like protein
VKVVVGQTFVGPPVGLTYEPGAQTEGDANDSFNFMVTDPGGLSSAAATVSISITKAVNKGAVTFAGGILRIGGTPKDDTITVTQSALGKLLVRIGGKLISGTVDASSVSEIRIWGRAGSDTITLTGITNNAVIVGGSGNDRITGGDGNDILVGSSGSDTLNGGGGDDLLMGGNQPSSLFGGAGNDILVGGGVNAIASLADLRAILSNWSGSLTVTADDTATAKRVFNRGNKGDKMTGGDGINWFMTGVGDSILDKKLTDFLTTLP